MASGSKPSKYTPEMDRAIVEGRANGFTYSHIARQLGITKDACRNRHLELKKERRSRGQGKVGGEGVRADATPKDGKNQYEDHVKGDVRCVSAITDTIRTLEDLLAYMKVDLNVWEVAEYKVNKWDGFARVSSEKVSDTRYERQLAAVQLFQVKANLKRKSPEIALNNQLREDLVADMRRNSPTYKPVRRRPSLGGIMAELSIPDPHFGKLCWAEETGGDNWDLKITESAYLKAVEDMLTKLQPYHVSKILLPVGNDLLHTDGKENATAAGTPQDVDGRWQKSFRVATQAVIRAIEMCRGVAPVEALIVPGNHDYERTFYLGDVVEARFHRCKDVRVDNRPNLFKWVEYGQTLVGFLHGDKMSPADLPMFFANAAPLSFARATHRELHLGHLHTRKHTIFKSKKMRGDTTLHVDHGVHVRVLPSLCPADAWHAQNGYTDGPRSAEAYLWEEGGFAGMLVHNVTA
jgi:hypothetical protein